MNEGNSLSTSDSELRRAIVLVVDDNPTTTDFLVKTLSPYYRVFSADSGEDAIGFCVNHAPDLVILDLHMPVLDGLITCEMLKAIPSMQNCPIVFSTADTSPEQEIKCWNAGATDFINKPIVVQTLVKRIRSHVLAKLQKDYIKNKVFIDPQTGLYNRRYFNECYEKQIALTKINDAPLSLVIFELTDTSSLDGQHASSISEIHLRKMTQLISGSLINPTDTLSRYNENQFAVLLPNTYIFAANHIIQKVLNAVAEFISEDKNLQFKHLDIAAGMASLEALQKNTDLIDLVERNLEQNKLSGKTMVSRYYMQ